MTLFRSGIFLLHSGGQSKWRIDCDALTTEDYKGLVTMALEVIPQFSEVIGVPRGGLAFAEALRPHVKLGAPNLLIVDDVLTSGNSMEKMRVEHPNRNVVGLVAFARQRPPTWVKALWVRG